MYIVSGNPTLHTNDGATPLSPGICAGFAAGSGDAHRLVNASSHDVVYLEVGDRTPGDRVTYPDDDLVAVEEAGRWRFFHRDGSPYPEGEHG